MATVAIPSLAPFRVHCKMTAPRSATSLRDENQRLRIQLKNCELSCQRAERQVAELQSRMRQAEVEAARQLRLKEAEWMAEYDRSVQALLKIVQHHEDEKTQLRAEVERLRELAAAIPPSITKMTRSTQTEISKQVQVAPRRPSVRFAKECETVSGKEEVACLDVKTKNNIARMQRLFEQLQIPRNQRDSDRSIRKAKLTTDLVRGGNDHSDPSCSFKAAILERLKDNQAAGRRRHVVVTVSEDSTRKTTETQTDEMSVPKQEAPSATLQQDLEERNRLLNVRLAAQQKVLDQLLLTKLEQASDQSQNGAPTTPCDLSRVCVVNEQVEAQNKSDNITLSTNPAEYPHVTQNGERLSESAGTVGQRPLSPAAA